MDKAVTQRIMYNDTVIDLYDHNFARIGKIKDLQDGYLLRFSLYNLDAKVNKESRVLVGG